MATIHSLRTSWLVVLAAVAVAAVASMTSTRARAQVLTPIADIHANLGTLTGTEVTVEGVVYVPANYRGTILSGYIQDESARGLDLFGNSTPNATWLNTVGNRVRVTGTVNVFGGTTVELTPITAVTFISSGNTISPQQVSTSAANNAAFEGTFIETAGTVSSSALTGTNGINYTVNDGSGPIVVRVMTTLNVPQIANGTPIFARGAGTNFAGTYQILVGQTSDVGTGSGGDITPPTLVSASSTDGLAVQVHFSENVDTATGGTVANYAVFETATPVNTKPVSSASASGPQVTLTLASTLTNAIQYTVRVQGVKDTAGNTMVGPQSTTFTAPPPPALGIYADQMGTNRHLCAEQNAVTTFYLLGRVPSPQPPGARGAEFRIEVSSPAGYSFVYTPPESAQAFGSPFDITPSDPNDATGTSVFFTSCQFPSQQPDALVDFGRVAVLNTGGGATTLRIRAKQPPDNPVMPCPRFFLCDAPLNTPVCMSPVLVGDIVYEVPLNPGACPPPAFTAETLQLDTHQASNDGAAGPVGTSQPLDHRQWFLVTVQGTASMTMTSSWAMPPNVVCGIPEPAPQSASPDVGNYWVGTDAEINFAAALPPGSDCNAIEAFGYPRHHTRFQVDLGDGFAHLEPLAGAPSDPAPSHRYRFLVQGRDAAIRFRWEEAQTSDNYGVFSIHVEQVDPTDATPVMEFAPRRSGVRMLGSVPNPFNPATVIRYLLPSGTDVTVEVYDIRGRVIRRLFDGPQHGGYHSVTWDGRADSGTRAPSGAYFARVTTPRGGAAERVTLVK